MYNIIYSHTVIPKYGENILSQVFYFTESTATNKKSLKKRKCTYYISTIFEIFKPGPGKMLWFYFTDVPKLGYL